MRNLPDRARTPGTQQLVRQGSLAQTSNPGVSGYHPHFAVLAHSCVRNATAHSWGGHSCVRNASAHTEKAEIIKGSGPVSRVLSGTAIYLEPASPQASSTQPGCTPGSTYSIPICACSRWGLPSYVVANALVRFYHTVSAFPWPGRLQHIISAF